MHLKQTTTEWSIKVIEILHLKGISNKNDKKKVSEKGIGV